MHSGGVLRAGLGRQVGLLKNDLEDRWPAKSKPSVNCCQQANALINDHRYPITTEKRVYQELIFRTTGDPDRVGQAFCIER
jgi:hypothetical protein